MLRSATFSLTSPGFGSRYSYARRLARLGQVVQRWLAHARAEHIATRLCDLWFNPFLFQIE